VPEFSDAAVLPVPPERAFDLALDIDAHQAAFHESAERAIDGTTTGVIGLDEFVTWRARHFGLMWTMTSRITEWDRPRRFVDEQQRGPFASFRHEHTFEPHADGTLMRDHVAFRAPLGPLGRIAEVLVLERYLRRLIRIRNEFLVAAARDEVTSGPELTKGATQVWTFAFEPKVARWSRLFGVQESTASVALEGDELVIRFGWWRLRTPVANVASACITGPYRAWKVAGPARLSLADRGITFATSTGPGLCIGFHQPVAAIAPFGLLRHPAATVTVADVEGLRRALGVAEAVPAPPAARPRGTLIGTVRGLCSWRRRAETVEIDVSDTDEVDVPAEAAAPRPDGQPIQSGVGAVFHRRYRTAVTGAQLTPEELMGRIQANPDVLTCGDLGPFVKDRGAASTMAVGDRFTVETAGPWSGPVEVVDVQPTSFRLATLGGHMEAGLIEFRVEQDGDETALVIESWARSGDAAMDALYDRLHVAKAIQSEMWVVAGEQFVELSGGTPAGPVEITEERASS